MLVQAPSPAGFRRVAYEGAPPLTLDFTPIEGGLHLVVLRERFHNRWLGKLRLTVAGDPLRPA
jgi:hypothetical protein